MRPGVRFRTPASATTLVSARYVDAGGLALALQRSARVGVEGDAARGARLVPFTVRLETERRDLIDQVFDAFHVLGTLLPPREDTSFACLRYIDRCGDTVFNRLQITPFLVEWERVQAAASGEETRRLLERIEDLARRCQRAHHLYLRFVGD
jgi:hypothetical protein